MALAPEGKNLILGECKYWQEPVEASVLYDLEAKTNSVPWERNHRKVWYALFSVSGFSEELKTLASSMEDVFLCEY